MEFGRTFRRRKPRIYLTVVGFYLLVIGIGSVAVPVGLEISTPPPAGGASDTSFLYFIYAVPYLVAAVSAGILMLRKQISTLSFLVPAGVLLLTTLIVVLASRTVFTNLPESLQYSISKEQIQSIYISLYGTITVLISALVMDFLLLFGWNEHRKLHMINIK